MEGKKDGKGFVLKLYLNLYSIRYACKSIQSVFLNYRYAVKMKVIETELTTSALLACMCVWGTIESGIFQWAQNYKHTVMSVVKFQSFCLDLFYACCKRT